MSPTSRCAALLALLAMSTTVVAEARPFCQVDARSSTARDKAASAGCTCCLAKARAAAAERASCCHAETLDDDQGVHPDACCPAPAPQPAIPAPRVQSVQSLEKLFLVWSDFADGVAEVLGPMGVRPDQVLHAAAGGRSCNVLFCIWRN